MDDINSKLVDFTLDIIFNWSPVENKRGISYKFPEKITSYLKNKWNGPAVYRWVVRKNMAADLPKIYVGETDFLPKRIQGYLKPGKSQNTNIEFNALFEELRRKGEYDISLEVLDFHSLNFGKFQISKEDLDEKCVRVFLESLFVIYYLKSGYQVLNKTSSK